jgi:hypothetical protein
MWDDIKYGYSFLGIVCGGLVAFGLLLWGLLSLF